MMHIMNIIIKYKKIIKDVVLNIFASGIMVALLQLLVYPSLNQFNNIDAFGEILIIMAVVNIIGVLLGSSLNNIRLKYHNDYISNKLNGDFSLLVLISTIFNIIVTLICLNVISELTIWELITLVLISVLTMLRAYMIFEYRVNLLYERILQHGLVYSLGLVIGLVIVYITSVWQLVFLVAEIVSFVFLLLTTKVIREPILLTNRFKSTSINFLYLALSNALTNILMYLDRLILYPILGAHQVAIFFAATIIGKMSSFVLTPISGVVLSYLSRREENISTKVYLKTNILIMFFCLIVSILAVLGSFLLLPLLYSDLYKDTLEILIVANISAVINASTSIPQTIVLKYSKTYHQISIQIIYTVLYLALGISFLHTWGLIGFCFGLLISSLIKYFITFMFGYKSLSTSN
ncbi:hypothetical protein [Priestia filamentosa]|uniref:lipopolysaccharide biosynthesis protein n=1 Tax=Priestia filamentosa TaxID=1402861 RepID=UPI002E1CA7F3|nr:hypothetical protein [Priestia filamentosa]